MGKKNSNKRKSQNHEVQTPKKQKVMEENEETQTPVSNEENIPKIQNTPKNQKKNAPKVKLEKFSGTGNLQSKEDANSSGEESDYKVDQIIKPEKITKTMNEDNRDSDEADDDSEDECETEEMENAVNENSENDEKKFQTKNVKNNQNQSKGDRTEEIKAFIESESAKGKMRYVLFLGNLPYSISIEEIKDHFKDGINVKSVRIPVGKGPDKKPRGFGYLEVADKESYIKAFTMHHTFLKGRRLNILYTTGGKKNSTKTKSIIKSKNFKLNALRRDGKLEGTKKHSQKRSVRRAKKRSFEKKTE